MAASTLDSDKYTLINEKWLQSKVNFSFLLFKSIRVHVPEEKLSAFFYSITPLCGV